VLGRTVAWPSRATGARIDAKAAKERACLREPADADELRATRAGNDAYRKCCFR
jgi:hypothetical protein